MSINTVVKTRNQMTFTEKTSHFRNLVLSNLYAKNTKLKLTWSAYLTRFVLTARCRHSVPLFL